MYDGVIDKKEINILRKKVEIQYLKGMSSKKKKNIVLEDSLKTTGIEFIVSVLLFNQDLLLNQVFKHVSRNPTLGNSKR